MYLLQDPDSDYDAIRTALIGCAAITFGAAAEAIFTADRGKLVQFPVRLAADKLHRWLTKLTQEAATVPEALKNMMVAALRSVMLAEQKTYVNLTRTTKLHQFLMVVEEWERSQPEKKQALKQTGGYGNGSTVRQGQHNNFQAGHKRTLTFSMASLAISLEIAGRDLVVGTRNHHLQ